MKAKLAQFIAGLIIYSLFGMLMVFIATGTLNGNWGFIMIWTVGMALAHAFIMEPFRKRLEARKAKLKK
jgi:F0F1-type ATP synthase assembly protein I